MDRIKKGTETEERCFTALQSLAKRYPKLVLSAKRASPELDARGIDFLIRIRLLAGAEITDMTVPLQVKSSSAGVAKWKVIHPDLDRAGVLIVYLPEKLTHRKVTRLLYRALDRVRLNSCNGTLYNSLFQRLFVGGSRNLERIAADIRARRARNRNDT